MSGLLISSLFIVEIYGGGVMKFNERHKNLVELRGDNYIYIGTYKKGDVTIDKNKLVSNTAPYIRVKCPYCGAEYDIRYQNFINNNQNCSRCCNKYENSFAYHIEIELRENLDKYWDFKKNKLNPFYIYKYTKSKVWIKCQEKEYHESYEIKCDSFSTGHRCNYCSNSKTHPKDSFLQYCIDNIDNDFLTKYWSRKNILDPSKISPYSENKVWVKCQEKEYHGDYITSCSNFTNGNRCPYCNRKKIHPKDSFAQYCIDNIDPNFLEKYWSDRNTLNPWELAIGSNKKMWLKCNKEDYHDDYLITPAHFTEGNRCPYCSKRNGKIHYLDSFGVVCKDKLKYWSKNNKVSPFNIAPQSGIERIFICQDCGKEFKRKPNAMWGYDDVKCLNCSKSKGEKAICNILNEKNISYEEQKTFHNLKGLGGKLLSYDFYLPKYNLLIEYQGEFHDGTAQQQSEHGFKRQQEHDRRKREYSKSMGIQLLEIWYCDFNNIEKILSEQII